MMKYSIRLLGCMFISSLAVTSPAQDAVVVSDGQSQPEPIDADDIEGLNDDVDAPERRPRSEIAFEVSEEELQTNLFRADPELLEQQFAANIQLFVPERSYWQLPWQLEPTWQLEPNSMRESAAYRLFAFREGLRPRSPLGRTGRQVARVLEEDARNAGETIGSFLPDALEKGYFTYIGGEGVNDGDILYFRLLAPTEELARKRSEAFVRMLDRAVKLPLNQHLRAEVQAREQVVETLQAKLEDAQRVATAIDEEYQEVRESGIDSDELSRLKTERRLLDVDLAGIRARIDAAEEILAKLDRNAIGDRSRIEKLEDIKVTAEIDLAGLAARRNALDQFIEAGILRGSLAAKSNEKQQVVREMRNALESDKSRLAELLQVQQAFAQLFALKDNKIVIQPIKWTGTE